MRTKIIDLFLESKPHKRKLGEELKPLSSQPNLIFDINGIWDPIMPMSLRVWNLQRHDNEAILYSSSKIGRSRTLMRIVANLFE